MAHHVEVGTLQPKGAARERVVRTMTNQCDSCTAPATLAICNRCAEELKAQLHELAHGPKVNGHTTAGLLDACEDVVLRRTRPSTGGGHRKKGTSSRHRLRRMKNAWTRTAG